MSFLNKVVYNIAFASGYSCKQTSKGLRVLADKVDAAGAKCDDLASKYAPKLASVTPITK